MAGSMDLEFCKALFRGDASRSCDDEMRQALFGGSHSVGMFRIPGLNSMCIFNPLSYALLCVGSWGITNMSRKTILEHLLPGPPCLASLFPASSKSFLLHGFA